MEGKQKDRNKKKIYHVSINHIKCFKMRIELKNDLAIERRLYWKVLKEDVKWQEQSSVLQL